MVLSLRFAPFVCLCCGKLGLDFLHDLACLADSLVVTPSAVCHSLEPVDTLAFVQVVNQPPRLRWQQ